MGEQGSPLDLLDRSMSRRGFLRTGALATLAGVAAACSKSSPKVTATTGTTTGSTSAPATSGPTTSPKPTGTTTIKLTNDFLPDLINAWYQVGNDHGYF